MLGAFWNLVVLKGYPHVPHGAVAPRNDGAPAYCLHYFEQFSNTCYNTESKSNIHSYIKCMMLLFV